MLQDHSRNRTPMPAAQPPAGSAPPDPGPARAETEIARMLTASAATASTPTEIDLARMVVDYFGSDPIDDFLNGDIALRDCARTILAAAPTQLDATRAEAGITRMRAGSPVSATASRSNVSDDLRAALDDLAAAEAAGLAETNDDDAAFGVHEARQDAADEVVLTTSCRSLADVGAKLASLIPRIRPDLLNKRHAEHLEAMRSDIDRLVATAPSARQGAAEPRPAPAGELGADASLIALVARFEAADRAREAADDALDVAYDASAASEPTRPAALRRAGDFRHFWGGASNPDSPEFYDADEVRRLRAMTETGHLHQRDTDAALARAAEIGAAWDEWFKVSKANDVACGVVEAEARYEELHAACQAIRSEILVCRPSTLAGLAAKARAWKSTAEKDFAEAIRADLVAMGEVEERLRIEASLSDQIIACWREWAALPDFDETEQGKAEFNRLSTERSALCDAAEALPVELGNVPTKALALAWLEYVDLWQHGAVREAYGLDGRLALDIDTAICGRLKTRYSGEAA